MKTILVVVFSLFGLSMYLNHGSAAARMHTLHGTIKDADGAVIAGVRIKAEPGLDKSNSDYTDINGDFEMSLPVGDHVLTVDSVIPNNLKAFIKITEQGPNPDNVQFVVDPIKICCVTATGEPFAKPVSLPKPAYPPAARAVRAVGDVGVTVKIDQLGKVLSAVAVSGHPLLRSASVVAAKESLFDSSELPEREVRLVYAFIHLPNLRSGLKRYVNPYRIEVTLTETVIQSISG